jgi:hypothetical protein
MLVDRDDLPLAAVQTDSLEKTGYKTPPGDYCVRPGLGLYVKAVRTARQKVGVEHLLALLIPVGRARCLQ